MGLFDQALVFLPMAREGFVHGFPAQPEVVQPERVFRGLGQRERRRGRLQRREAVPRLLPGGPLRSHRSGGFAMR